VSVPLGAEYSKRLRPRQFAISDRDSVTYLDELLKRHGGPSELRISYIYLKDPTTIVDPGSLVRILDLEDSQLSQTARETLSGLEADELTPSIRANWRTFKWRLLGFVTLQDVFDSPLLNSGSVASLFRLWYFYYESKHLLTEAILCSLNGFHAGSNSLLRPLLEFTLLQQYFRRRVYEADDYSELERYFRTGQAPGWHRLIRYAIPKGGLPELVRFRVKSHLDAL
jgi:hypothetical protein